MIKQIIFAIILIITLSVFGYTVSKIMALFRLTKPATPVRDFGKRVLITLKVALGQTKIFRRPVVGLMHALVWWGFLIILFGSIEMVIDGLAGTERILGFLGVVYNIIIASGDIFALVIIFMVIAFLVRRIFMHINRFRGIEMKHKSHVDANISLLLILFLMITLLGYNTFYVVYSGISGHELTGVYPVSHYIAFLFGGVTSQTAVLLKEINWWSHIVVIFLFANYLPYSKHFHVFMSVPNVFISNLEPPGKMKTMDSITKEVKLMMDTESAFSEPDEEVEEDERFGILDIEDITWKNYLNSLACTQCGRCTSVCPANITGKLLSPRKVMMDVRSRMEKKGPQLIRNGKDWSDGYSLQDFITPEELWACTTCNACVQECPVNIDQLSIILDMRRYIVMEQAAAPVELNQVFSNIENNGAPWQFSQEDRMNWAEELYMNQPDSLVSEEKRLKIKIEVPVMADLAAKGKKPRYLFWVGSAGAFDDRYKKVIRQFVRVLTYLGTDYAVLGTEETSSGDVARRTGNEMLFQMQALMNIELLRSYDVKKVITCDPHVYNTFKNEYPDLGADFEVIHHSRFLRDMIKEGRLNLNTEVFRRKKITYHDPCYLGRANGEYNAPREIIGHITSDFIEMRRNKSYALCCGAGGGQMFKEAEKGNKEIFIERTEEALETGAEAVVTACPYCMVMITDGLKYKNREQEVKNYDLAELVALSLGL
jgi:Fe-S oxidoreductase/nitrate reductase gamma subunit